MRDDLVNNFLDAFELVGVALVTVGGKPRAKGGGAMRCLRAKTRDQEGGTLLVVRTIHEISQLADFFETTPWPHETTIRNCYAGRRRRYVTAITSAGDKLGFTEL